MICPFCQAEMTSVRVNHGHGIAFLNRCDQCCAVARATIARLVAQHRAAKRRQHAPHPEVMMPWDRTYRDGTVR